jgi:hypothetical protein
VDWIKHSFITEQSLENQVHQYIGFAQHIIKSISVREPLGFSSSLFFYIKFIVDVLLFVILVILLSRFEKMEHRIWKTCIEK